MKGYIEERAVKTAEYIIETKATVEITAPDEFIPTVAAPFRHQAAGVGQVG